MNGPPPRAAATPAAATPRAEPAAITWKDAVESGHTFVDPPDYWVVNTQVGPVCAQRVTDPHGVWSHGICGLPREHPAHVAAEGRRRGC